MDFADSSIVMPEDMQEAEQAIVDADAAVGGLTPNLLAKAHQLRWLQAPHAAPNTANPQEYYYPELVSHPVVVTSFKEIYSDHLGAHVMMYVLNFARGMQHYTPRQMRGEWKREPNDTGVVVLGEATMLIIGVGGVGGEVSRLASAFGMRVIGIDPLRSEAPAGMCALHTPDKLDELLPEADFVVLTAPHTPATEGFFNYARFCRMKPGGFFINIGRGRTVVLDDLSRVLSEQKIAGAGLDVCEVEPLPPAHPLWTTPGVIITPHTGGYGAHLDERRYEVIRDNKYRFMHAQPLRNVVDKENWF